MTWHVPAALAAIAAQLTPVTAAAPETMPVAAAAAVPDVDIIELENERYRRMTVPVTIGGEGPFKFMLDTGAQATVVSRALADRLSLNERKSAILVGMASRRPVETTQIYDVGLGTRTFYIRSAPVVEGENIGGADGILGLDSLQDQRVLLDFDKREILVADAEALGGNRGYEIVVRARQRLGQLIITEARLDGVRVAVVVDSGAQGSIGNPELLRRFRRSRHMGESEVTDINGEVLSGIIKLGSELQIDRARLNNIPIMFADSPTFHALGLADEPALILGMAELKLFRRVAIDFKSRRVLFDLPPQARFAGREAIDFR
ncbi:MAG TPA: retroviral-like aspartic protease family protein [Croceibacterium sp.]